MTYASGHRVTHAQYGDGTIVNRNEYHTVIDFDANGLRTFSSPRVVLASASTEAPAKPVRRPRAKRAASSPGDRPVA
jgi:hypothetical protein